MLCPFGVIQKDEARHVAVKCDLCPDLPGPACVAACPTDALRFEEAGDFARARRKATATAGGECCGPAPRDCRRPDMTRHYVILGASAAGIGAAARLRELDPQSVITVVGEEPHYAYYRPLLPYLIDGRKTLADIAFWPEQWYAEQRVR